MREPLRLTLTLLVAVVVLFSFGLLYLNHTNRQNDLRWCGLMIGLDERYQALKTEDPDAMRFRDQVHTLREELHCPPPPLLPQNSPTP